MNLATLLLSAAINMAPVNSDTSHYVAGYSAFLEGDTETAHVIWEKLAYRGDPRSQYGLAVMFELGQGVAQNYNEAARWYQLAADQHYAMASNNLAMLYEAGKGVPKDISIAVELYREAATQGLPSAQYNLALLHYEGVGVPRDYVLASQWLKLAADNGVSSALYNLGVIYQNGQGVDQDDLEAARWYVRAQTRGAEAAAASLAKLIVRKERAVGASSVAVYASPSADSTPVSRLSLGDTVYALQADGGWVAVLLDDRKTIGWIPQKSLVP